jgi:hypothetical protein
LFQQSFDGFQTDIFENAGFGTLSDRLLDGIYHGAPLFAIT